MNETALQQHIRLHASNAGVEIWRNNSGVLRDETGRPVRYGLANDSPQLNKQIKSSDLIGVTPVVITQQHVGQLIGVFTAIECKHEGWTMRPSDDRALAQMRFHVIVCAAGGYAGFATRPEDFYRITRR